MRGSERVVKAALSVAAVLLALAWGVTACGGTDTSASVLESTTAETSVPKDAQATTGATEMPAVGASVTLSSITEAAIPADKLIEELRFDSSGTQTLRLVVDLGGHKGFREMVTSPNVPYPGFGFMVFDDGGHSKMGEMNLEVTPYGGADFAQIVGIYDPLSGKTATVSGYETLDGRQTFVARTTLSIGAGERSIEATAAVDPVTDLIVREEYRAGGTTEQRERRIIDATPELLARMDIKNMDSTVAAYRQTRENGLTDAPFPVYGLPSGYRDLPLSWTIPFPDGRMVVLQYGKPASGDYVSVTTLDPRKYPDYSPEYLAPLELAWIDPAGAGDLTEMRFGIGEVGIQIQAPKDVIRQVAEDLVVVGGPGS